MKKSVLFSTMSVLAAAVLLFAVRFGLSALAAQNAEAERLSMMQTLLPGSTVFEPESYSGEEEAINWVERGETGYVMQTSTRGYVNDIVLMVGVSFDGRVTGVVVREMEETPGLGAGVLSASDFLAQFINTAGEAEVGSTVDALSGATVTSKAVAKGINAAVAYVTGADISSGATEWGG